MFEKLKGFCDSFLDMGIPGFDLMVMKDGECILRHMGGYSRLENKTKIQGNEKYYVYSCSKPITCTAALQLWERGLFSLDDEVGKYLPEFYDITVRGSNGPEKAKKPILVRHLFEMGVGYSYDIGTPNIWQAKTDLAGKFYVRDFMRYLVRDPIWFEPGEGWMYGLCHDILAALVEVVSGQSFEDYVQENIFRPLGMTDSTFMHPYNEADTLCGQYVWDAETKTAKPVYHNWCIIGEGYACGGGGCVSTVEDYMKFLEALRKGDIILKKSTIDLMATDRLTEKQRSMYDSDTHGYGLGIRTPKKDGIHNDIGWGGAAGAYLAVDRERGISIYYAQHMQCSPNQALRSLIYDYVVAELYGDERFIRNIEQTRNTEDYHYTY